jgi:glycosyltransferase involved in cell wall biosynthesis
VDTYYSLSLIVPVYNECGLLVRSLMTIDDFLSAHFRDYEIVVIESGSTDCSGEICDDIALHNSRVKVIHEGARNGFGAALKLGYENASKDLVLLYTVDMPFSLEYVLEALPHLSRCDCVLSYRSHDNRSAYRRLQSFAYNLIVKTLLGLKFKHVNSAFKLMKRERMQDLRISSNHWFSEAELLYRLQEKHIAYTEIPVPLVDRMAGRSTVTPFTFLETLRELLRFRRVIQSQKPSL